MHRLLNNKLAGELKEPSKNRQNDFKEIEMFLLIRDWVGKSDLPKDVVNYFCSRVDEWSMAGGGNLDKALGLNSKKYQHRIVDRYWVSKRNDHIRRAAATCGDKSPYMASVYLEEKIKLFSEKWEFLEEQGFDPKWSILRQELFRAFRFAGMIGKPIPKSRAQLQTIIEGVL